MVIQSCTALSQNQSGLASRIDELVDRVDAMDSRVLSIAFSEGKWTLKCFKKETAWNTLSKEDKIKDFDAHLENLNIRCKAGVEVIQPNRANSFPFLKVTFICSGEKRDFFQKNKTTVNQFNTSYLVPMSIADREREIKNQLQKDICTILSGKGYRVQDKDVTFFLKLNSFARLLYKLFRLEHSQRACFAVSFI